MDRLRLSQINIGMVDGKEEFLVSGPIDEKINQDTFIIPDGFDDIEFGNSRTYFVEGYRGTGKTSLLRWHAAQKRLLGERVKFILFKTGLTETQRAQISTHADFQWAEIDSGHMEFSQDFKESWVWFIVHSLGEMIIDDLSLISPDCESVASLKRALGLDEKPLFTKILGFLPKMEAGKIKIKGDLGVLASSLEGELSPNDKSRKITLEALAREALNIILKTNLKNPLRLYFDELETFYHTEEQLRRDQRLVRDLIFAIGKG